MNLEEIDHLILIEEMWDISSFSGDRYLEHFRWGRYFEYIRSPEAILGFFVGSLLIAGGLFTHIGVTKELEQKKISQKKIVDPNAPESIPTYLLYGLILTVYIFGSGFFSATCRKAIKNGYSRDY